MIAKRVYGRKTLKSSFSRLVTYITSGLGKEGRLGDITVTNCINDSPDWASREVEITQAQNRRTKADKTYHLLVSFREEDKVSAETLRIIEQRICDELGYSEHQRISAIHHDTDNLHIHIAINKVHPTKFSIHEPYYDKKKLGVLCAALEIEHNLAIDNHTAFRTKSETAAQDMEKGAGLESLLGWIQRGCMVKLVEAESWKELHHILSDVGLAITERGNGLVISNKDGIAVKASSIDKRLSKPALERKLGKYSSSNLQFKSANAGYSVEPMIKGKESNDLWEVYQQQKQSFKEGYALGLEKARKEKENKILAAKKRARLKRNVIKLTKGRVAKKLLYGSVSKSLLREIENAQEEYQKTKKSLSGAHQSRSWHEWLQHRAKMGDTKALHLLRSRYDREQRSANIITSKQPTRAKVETPNSKIDNVTKKGTIILRHQNTSIRDDGSLIRLPDNPGDAAMREALILGLSRFGKSLALSGSREFIDQAVKASVLIGLEISFSDPEIESRRQLAESKAKYRVINDDKTGVLSYVGERNQKRKAGLDILPHRPFTVSDAGSAKFVGLRYFGENALMLAERDKEILVLPIKSQTQSIMEGVKIGALITVRKDGVVKIKSRKI